MNRKKANLSLLNLLLGNAVLLAKLQLEQFS